MKILLPISILELCGQSIYNLMAEYGIPVPMDGNNGIGKEINLKIIGLEDLFQLFSYTKFTI